MDQMDILRALEHMPLFRGLPPGQKKILAVSAKEKNFPAGKMIILDSQEAKSLYVIVWGKVKIFKSSAEGKEQTIFIFGPGEPFCLTALTDEVSPASAMALDDTKIIYFPAGILEKVVREEPSILFNLLSLFSRRLKEVLTLVESISLKELPQRLATFLARSAILQKDGYVVELSFSHRELSKIMGTTPESLSRVFKKFAAQNILDVEGKIIIIRDYDALMRIASE
jgi:CRP/FNR family transcriptional regulator